MDRDRFYQQLHPLLHSNETPVIPLNKPLAVMSDIHLGDGGKSDDFRSNLNSMLAALQFYRDNDYRLILAGDVEELWQFDLEEITAEYNHTVYETIRSFGDHRVIRIFGNHDLSWRTLHDPIRNNQVREKPAHEAVLIKRETPSLPILVIHGHQGTDDSDRYSWLSSAVVRIFRKIEPLARLLGLYGHPSSARSQVIKNYERIYYQWAKQNRTMVICGHSHRAIFASLSYAERLQDQIRQLESDAGQYRERLQLLKKELRRESKKNRIIQPVEDNGKPLPLYFNCGCALYTDGMTCLELTPTEIRLVKWDSRGIRNVYQTADWHSLDQQVSSSI